MSFVGNKDSMNGRIQLINPLLRGQGEIMEQLISQAVGAVVGNQKSNPSLRLSKQQRNRESSHNSRWRMSKKSVDAASASRRPWDLVSLRRMGETYVGGNAPLAGVVRLVSCELRSKGLKPRIVGPTLLAWTKMSQLMPWETVAHLLVGSLETDHNTMVDALQELPQIGLTIRIDAGGARVEKSGCRVNLYLKHPERDTVCASPKGNELGEAMAKQHKITRKDLFSSKVSEAVLDGSIIVYVPKPKFINRSLRRWINGRDSGKIPSIQPPRPWIWSAEKKRYVKAEFFDYYLAPPFGKKTVMALLVALSILGAVYLLYYVSINHMPTLLHALRPAPKPPSSSIPPGGGGML